MFINLSVVIEMLQTIPIPPEGHVVRKCPKCQEIVIEEKFPDDPPESELLIYLCGRCNRYNHMEDRYQFYNKYGFLLKY